MRYQSKGKFWFYLIVLIGGICVTYHVYAWLIYKPRAFVDNVSYSRNVYARGGELLRITLSLDQKFRIYQPLKDYPISLINAFKLKEDQHFNYHFGINPVSLCRAFYRTYVLEDRRVGGSTITMQLARLLYGLKTSTIGGKIRQIFEAVRLELALSKEEILETYLNLAPMGGNIEGVSTASFLYFKKPTEKLTIPQILTLVSLPQNPSALLNVKHVQKLHKSRQILLQQWLDKYPQSCTERTLCSVFPELHYKPQKPFLAPHFTDFILARTNSDFQFHTHTTLHLPFQKMVESLLQQYIKEKENLGIKNAAALVLNHKTMELIAMVGSADFADVEISGQVNGTLAKRSPGSTLKPFIYGLGFDRGILHPKTLLKDAPLSFGAFSLENADGKFSGPVFADQALYRSRNVPAVNVALKLQDPSFYDFLKISGISGLKPSDHYGISIALGGAELTMWELVYLYAALGNLGKLQPIKFLAEDVNVNSTHARILSAEASYMVVDILQRQLRPGHYYIGKNRNERINNVFWKTGTSNGYKDAWTIGGIGPLIVAVWVGNFNGEGNKSFTGIKAGMPLFLKLIEGIKNSSGNLGFDVDHPSILFPPKRLRKVEVCSVSGALVSPYCPHKTNTWFIPGVSPIKTCFIHRKVELDLVTNYQVCPVCRGDKKTKEEIHEFWSSDLLAIFREAGLPRKSPPRHNPACVAAKSGYAPIILSPRKGVIYIKHNEQKGDRGKISLEAVADSDVATISWYVNKNLIGQVGRDEKLLWNPIPGTYYVKAVDDQGRSDSRKISVKNISGVSKN